MAAFRQGQTLKDFGYMHAQHMCDTLRLSPTEERLEYIAAKMAEVYLTGGIDALKDESEYLASSRMEAARSRQTVKEG